LQVVNKQFRNARIDDELSCKVVGLYNKIQSELTNLKTEAMQHLLENLKTDLAFNPQPKNILSKK